MFDFRRAHWQDKKCVFCKQERYTLARSVYCVNCRVKISSKDRIYVGDFILIDFIDRKIKVGFIIHPWHEISDENLLFMIDNHILTKKDLERAQTTYDKYQLLL